MRDLIILTVAVLAGIAGAFLGLSQGQSLGVAVLTLIACYLVPMFRGGRG